MKPPVRSPWAWAVPLSAALLAALMALSGSNRELFLFINRVSLYTGADLWANLTVLGDGLVAAVLLLPLLRRYPELVWAALLGAILSALWVHGLKIWFASPRPPSVFPADIIHVIGKAHYYNAFPSGHTTTAAWLAATIALYWRRLDLTIALLAAAVLIGISRIAVGVHWPLDVLAGVFGGWLAALGGHWWAQAWPRGNDKRVQIFLAVLLTLCALALPFHDTGYPQARPLQVVIAIAALVIGAPWRLFKTKAA